MTNQFGDGLRITITAPAAKSSGDGVKVGAQIFGVAVTDALINAALAIETTGIFDLAKQAGIAFTPGAFVYWDDTASECDNDDNNDLIGVCTATAAGGATTVRVRLFGSIQPSAAALGVGLDWKASVRAATTAAIADLAAATVTHDGVTLIAGERLLVKDQVAGAANGVYTVGTVVGGVAPLTRATDFDSSAEVTTGATVHVEEGTVAADQIYVLTTNAPIVLGTTALTFALFPTITAGNGLVRTVNDIAVVANADGSIVANANDVQLGRIAGATAPAAGATAAIYGISRITPAPAVADTPISVGSNRSVASGAGLTGGGDLTADRTLAIDFGEVGDVAAIGTAAAAGVLDEAARADHIHAHAAQTDGTLHAAAIAAGASGFMTGADKTKINGIEALADVTDDANVRAALAAATAIVNFNGQAIGTVGNVDGRDVSADGTVLDAVVAENTDGQILVPIAAGLIEAGAWTASWQADGPRMRRTAGAGATDAINFAVPALDRTTALRGIKPTGVRAKIDVFAAGPDDLRVEIVRVALGADGVAQTVTVLAGDVNADYDASHDLAAERAALHSHLMVISIPVGEQAYLAADQVLYVRVFVDGDAGAAAVVDIRDLVLTYAATHVDNA